MKLWPAILVLGLVAGCTRFEPRPLSPGASGDRLESRSLDNPALRPFLETNLHHQLSAWPVARWDFEMLTLAAFYYQPSLQVARATWAEASAGIITAGTRPNPTVGFTPQYVFNPGVEPPWIATFNLDWPIETGGKRGARLDQARHEAEVARLNLAVAAWQVRAHLRIHVIDYISATRREAVLRKELSLEEEMVGSLEQRRQAGAVAAAEVAPAQLRLQRTRLELSDAQRQQVEARAAVAESIGVPLAALNPVQLVYDLSAAPADLKTLNSKELRRAVLQNRSDIRAALADYAAIESALRLEIAKQYPDLHLNTGYEYDQGLQKWGLLGFGVELPLLNRNEGPIAQAEARRKQAAARFEMLQAKVIADIDRAVAVSEVSARSSGEAEAVLKTLQQQKAAAEQQLRAGAADRMDVLTAQLELAACELVLEDNRARLHQALGALEDTLQRPQADWPSAATGEGTQAQK